MGLDGTQQDTDESGAIMCPVCGGRVVIEHNDRVNYCEYCGSPVMGPAQDRNCAYHPDRLAKQVCHVCGRLICEECTTRRVGLYGGKALTAFHCPEPECKAALSWMEPVREEYSRLLDMEWAAKRDVFAFRVGGVGAILFMLAELVLVLMMLGEQFFTAWGTSTFPYLFVRGDLTVIVSVAGNLTSAAMLQVTIMVYDHLRQMTAGALALVFVVVEWLLVWGRVVLFNLFAAVHASSFVLIVAVMAFATVFLVPAASVAVVTGLEKLHQIRLARSTLVRDS